MGEKEFKKKEIRKILIVATFCLIAIISIVGYTYSYFVASDTDNTTITGTAASASLEIEVNKLAPSSNNVLVPQLDSAITSAVVGRNNKSCIDDNNNEVCQVYEIIVTNTSTMSINVDGFVELNANSNPNLKWARISNPAPTKPTLIGNINSHIKKALTTNENYAIGEVKTYYIVVWISEKEAAQEDTGIFTGTVTFMDSTSSISPALTTLTKLNLKDDYLGKGGIFNNSPVCLYEGNGVNSPIGETSPEYCNDIYRVRAQTGEVMYYDGSFSLVALYMGEGTWDSTNSVCTYNGDIVFDGNFEPIESEENCGSIYKLEEDTGEEIITVYISMIELLEGNGIYTEPLGDGIYSMEDDLGTSYFFRGDVENNYVKFADKYWRIIRINGDGTVRMIYDGTSAHENGEASTDRQITTSPFKSSPYNDNTYVGYMYGTAGVTATGETGYNQTHSNQYDSTIKTYLEDTWYANNIEGTNYEQYIADAIYCNDRSLDTSDASYTGIGTTYTQYAAYQRLLSLAIPEPTLKCKNQNDRFTYNATVGGVLGNDKLEAPVGLITADEVVAAGGSHVTENDKYYLYTGDHYWTMSPSSFRGSYADEFNVYFLGNLSYRYVLDASGVRPVLTLESDALKYSSTSNGSMQYPFTVTGQQ